VNIEKKLNLELMGHKVHIQAKDGRELDYIVDEVESGGNSDRYYPNGTGISYIILGGYKTILYADEIESIEITD